MHNIRKGSQVEWTWGAHEAKGKVEKTFTHDVERRIKGSIVKRKADAGEPALLIRQKNGNRVLKSRSEVGLSDDR